MFNCIRRKSRTLARSGSVCVLSISLVFASMLSAQANDIAYVTLGIESGVLDLDTGTVNETQAGVSVEVPGADVKVAYNAERLTHAVLVPAQREGVELVYLDEIPFDAVTLESTTTLVFSTQPVDLPLETHDTVVMRTDTGAMFKIGNAVETDDMVIFSYLQLN